MMLSRKELLTNKSRGREYLPQYLTELNSLFKCQVSAKNLLSLEDSEKIKDQSITALEGSKIVRKVFPFDDKPTLKIYFDKLLASYNDEIYVFTDYSKYCGIAIIPKFEWLNTSFRFEDEHAGIISIVTKSLDNNLVLDFSEDENGIRLIELEMRGKFWSSIETTKN